MKSAKKWRLAVSALLLFLVFVAVYPAKAQFPIGPIVLTPYKTVQRHTEQASIRAKPKDMNTAVGLRDSQGELTPNLTRSDFRAYDNLSEQTIDSVSSNTARLSDAVQTAPPSITPPGIFYLPPVPGTPQTPTTEAERASNINLGALAAWLLRHVSR